MGCTAESQQLWEDFLDKCEFVYLSDHPNGIPWTWLDELADFVPEGPQQAELLEHLRGCDDNGFRKIFREYLQRCAETVIARDPMLDLKVVLGDVTQFGCDVVVCWYPGGYESDYIGRVLGVDWNAEGQGESLREFKWFTSTKPGNPLNVLGVAAYTGSNPREFRRLCVDMLDEARRRGNTVAVVPMLPLCAEFKLSFAAAELISAAREFLLRFYRDEESYKVVIVSARHRICRAHAYWLQVLNRDLGPTTDHLWGDKIEPQPPLTSGEQITSGEGLKTFWDDLRKRLPDWKGLSLRPSSSIQTVLAEPTAWLAGKKVPSNVKYRLKRVWALVALGLHERALEELQDFIQHGGFSAWKQAADFLEKLVYFDRYLRLKSPQDLKICKEGVQRSLENWGREGAGMAGIQLRVLLGLSKLYSGEDTFQNDLREVKEELISLGESPFQELTKVCRMILEEGYVCPHYRGTPPPPECGGKAVVVPFWLEEFRS